MTNAIQLYQCDGCHRTGDVIAETPVESRWNEAAKRFEFRGEFPETWVCYCPVCREWYRECCQYEEIERINESGCAMVGYPK